MPVPGYDPILDNEIDPGSPGTSSLFTRLRDNVLAIIGGGTAAPLIDRKAISAGSTGTDGNWINGTALPGLGGYYEAETIVFSAPKTLPSAMVVRVNGNVTISDVLTVAAASASDALILQRQLGALIAADGTDAVALTATWGSGGGGGANVGAGGDAGAGSSGGTGTQGLGGAAAPITNLTRDWLNLRPRLGGKGGASDNSASTGDPTGGAHGGCLILIIEGDLLMTGGEIDADGGAGGVVSTGPGSGGGGGGTIIVICTGTITNGTYKARGGSGGTGSSFAGGKGGGGRIALIASAFAGARTGVVTAGAAGAGSPGAGSFDEYTLTAEQIRGLLFRSY